MEKSVFLKGMAAIVVGAALTGSVFYTIHHFPHDSLKRTSEESRERENEAAGFAEYIFNMKKNPVTGMLDYPAMVAAQGSIEQKRASYKTGSAGLQWTELGPDNVGGRTRALLIDRKDPKTLFAGGVSGGIWKSTNAGATWARCSGSDEMENMIVSCITQAADGSIYFGTGEYFVSTFGSPGGSFIGGGIWKSTDGDAFARLEATVPATSNSSSASWAFVNDLAADPVNPNRIYAATNSGLKITDDGGQTWTSAVSSFTDDVEDVEVWSDGGVIFAASGPNVLYASPNGSGGSFTKITISGSGLPTTGIRTVLATAPSDPNYVYASIATSAQTLQGIYRSKDKGLTWSVIGAGGSATFDPYALPGGGGQGKYDNSLAVFPDNKDHILAAGTVMWEWIEYPSNPGGQWYQAESYNGGVHPDIHAIRISPANPSILYVGTDGGVYRGNYNPNNILQPYQFSAISKDFNVTQFYSIAFEARGTNGNGVMGGTQDNGTHYVAGGAGGNSARYSYATGGGDGADCEISFINPNAFFTTVYYGSLERSSKKGESGSGSGFYSEKLTKAVPDIGKTPSTASFVTPIALYESVTATNSPDSITFTAGELTQDIPGANGKDTAFAGALNYAQPQATIIPGTVKFVSGSQVVTDDGNGNLQGDIGGGTNTIEYSAAKAFKFSFKTAPSSSNPVTVTFRVRYQAGAVINVTSKTGNLPFQYTTPGDIESDSSVQVQDIVQSKLAVGFRGSYGVWMTKGCLDFTKTPEWIKIMKSVNGTVESMAWSANGDILYIGTDAGSLYRLAGVAGIKDSATGEALSSQRVTNDTLIAGFSRAIIGLAVDPNNADRLLVTLAGYGSSTNVYYCSNATTAPLSGTTSNFQSKQGSGASTKLPPMPVYSALFVSNSAYPNMVLVGTDYGVYATTDITAGNPTWTDENTGMARVPVFAMRQQTLPPWNCNNSGVIYVGTYGRGMWKVDNYYVPTGITEKNNQSSKSEKSSVALYPNPLDGPGKVAFHLPNPGDVRISVYDLTGKVVRTMTFSELRSGEQKIDFDSQGLNSGAYLLSVDGDSFHAVTRFVVAR